MTSAGRRRAAATIRIVALAMLVALVAACGPASHVRAAKKSFSSGAGLENQSAMLAEHPDTTAPPGSPEQSARAAAVVHYRAALERLEQVLPAKEVDLRRDKLLGDALTIQALAQWRLALHNAALDTQERAMLESDDQFGVRDRSLIVALPGFIGIDIAYAQLHDGTSPPAPESRQEIISQLGAAIDEIERARTRVASDHPLQLYLLQAQFAAYRNMRTANERLSEAGLPSLDEAHARNAANRMAQFKSLLRDRGAGTSLSRYWETRLGLD